MFLGFRVANCLMTPIDVKQAAVPFSFKMCRYQNYNEIKQERFQGLLSEF
jgi:hypothetical protein